MPIALLALSAAVVSALASLVGMMSKMTKEKEAAKKKMVLEIDGKQVEFDLSDEGMKHLKTVLGETAQDDRRHRVVLAS